IHYCKYGGEAMNKYDQMRRLLQENNGYLFTAQVEKAGVSRTYLAKFVRENQLEKVAKGIYISQDTWEDELYILQICYPKIIYSGETALYLHGMIDREYTDICITVPPRFNQTRLRNRGVLVHQEKLAVYQLGMVEVETNYGNVVRTYDKERCICDMVKNRGNMEVQQFQTAMKTFMRDKAKNMSKLMQYGEQLKIRDEIMKYVEVML
ncbi:AbiEi antitoxin N-terminal domain-containing protein, partial [uncultured Clostridium sp.]|uniref:type IV toxin-antitoxin system AbiEi family antitoxin domain-containing protein n=2 Tax=uncultured Clostridium sp. TaxID=59620 RepID=UPI00258CE7E3